MATEETLWRSRSAVHLVPRDDSMPLSRSSRFISATLFCLFILLPGCASETATESNASQTSVERRIEPRSIDNRHTEVETQDPHPELPLSLDAAIDLAVSNNPDLHGAAWRIQQAQAARRESKARFWPQVSFYTEYLRGDAPSTYLFKTIDQRQLPPDTDFNNPGSIENFESGFEARMNLFAGGRDVAQYRMAEKDSELSRTDRRRLENDLVAEVIRTYYDTLAAGEFIAIAEESVATVTEQLRILQVQYEGGAVLKSDVLSMQVRLAQARETLVSSRNRLQLSKAALANLMGFPPSSFADNDTVSVPTSADLYPMPANYQDAIEVALANRPELEQMRLRLEKSQIALSSSKSTYSPRLDFIARYYFDDPDLDYERDRENWTAALLLKWDLFTGFKRSAAVGRSEARVGEMVAAERKAALQVALDVKTAYLNLEEAGTRYEVASSSVDNAEESFRLVREHYLGGAVTVTRYLEAELDRNRARTRAAAARYDKMKAAADVARSLGQWANLSEKHNSI